MAPTVLASQTHTVDTLPRLLAINKTFTDLDEQISQATHIIGLPGNWETIQEEKARSTITRTLVRARAEWVLRWILDKLKDEADSGIQARANPQAWKLLDWMILVLPPSRSATHLRDAGFLSILEKTLEENFEKDVTKPIAADVHDIRSKGASDSSETAHEDSKPSRKRKRPSSGTSTPSKKVALEAQGLEQLFSVMTTVVGSIVHKAGGLGNEGAVCMEHMKMALRTESAQAARMLKYWMIAVRKLLSGESKKTISSADEYMDLTLVLEIWELRTVEADDDSGASAEQFSTECLIPALALYNQIQDHVSSAAQRTAIQELERLLARHLFAPSRASYFVAKKSESGSNANPTAKEAKYFASNLEPLRAKLLQAAQILDTSEPLPNFFVPLFQSISQLLDMAIRFSPSRTPKTRIAEKPWIQAAFVALAECVGCPLEAPEFVISKPSLDALEKCVHVMTYHEISIESDILEDLFWFHSGVRFPPRQERTIQWPLIAALIELDSGLFLTKPKIAPPVPGDRPDDLATFLFNQISTLEFGDDSIVDVERMDIDTYGRSHPSVSSQDGTDPKLILKSIILPTMSAYARNRDLLGFLRRWDTQLYDNALSARSPMKSLKPSVWQDRNLIQALAQRLEESLTQPQILELFKQHLGRIKNLRTLSEGKEGEDPMSEQSQDTINKGFSSAVILYAILGSISSDETTESLKHHLLLLLKLYVSMVQSDWHRSNTHIEIYWKTLGQLLAHLWPVTIHGSSNMQASLVLPVVNQASKDIAVKRKSQNGSTVDSQTRAAALMFLLTACDHLRTVPGQDPLVQEGVRKALKTLSASRLGPTDLKRVGELFCTDYSHLLEQLEPDAREKAIVNLLYRASEMDQEVGVQIADALSEALFTFGSSVLQDAFAAALLSATDEADENELLRNIIDNTLLRIRPSALSRDRREAILNKITDTLMSQPRNINQLLSIMNHLMGTPNATANISSKGGMCFRLAKLLHQSNVVSSQTLFLFQELVQLTLGHILPNKNQAQNKRFLKDFEETIATILNRVDERSMVNLAILRATFSAQKEERMLLSPNDYIVYLDASLKDESLSTDYVIDAFNEFPAVQSHGEFFDTAKSVLRSHFFDAEELLKPSGGDFIAKWQAQHCCRLHSGLGRYGLFTDANWFLQFTQKLLQEQLTHVERTTVLKSFADAASLLENSTRLDLVQQLMQPSCDAQDRTQAHCMLDALVSTLDDKHVEDVALKQQQLFILPRLCSLLAETASYPSFNALLDSIDTVLRDKHSLTTQHSIECVLTVLVKLASRNSPNLASTYAREIYTRLCETSRLILLLHRSRLGGRFHLLLPLLQNLLFCLFIPNAGRGMPLPPWLKPISSSSMEGVKLTPANANSYVRVLSTLCSPTHFSVAKPHKSSTDANTKIKLNDPVKAAKEYASHYLYPLLGSFCRFQLSGKLEPEVRSKLIMGMWEVVAIAGMDRSALDAMFAGLDRSTRDVWRGLWSEYTRANGGRERESFRGGD